MEGISSNKFEEIYNADTILENFFYYKIDEVLIRKKDLSRLLLDQWLSEHVISFNFFLL